MLYLLDNGKCQLISKDKTSGKNLCIVPFLDESIVLLEDELRYRFLNLNKNWLTLQWCLEDNIELHRTVTRHKPNEAVLLNPLSPNRDVGFHGVRHHSIEGADYTIDYKNRTVDVCSDFDDNVYSFPEKGPVYTLLHGQEFIFIFIDGNSKATIYLLYEFSGFEKVTAFTLTHTGEL